MKLVHLVLIAVIALLVRPAVAADFIYADPATGAAILTADDDYFAALGPADVPLRLKSDKPQALATLKQAYRGGVREWDAAGMAVLDGILDKYRDELAALSALLPETVLFIRVTDQVEGALPHTRANAIVLPVGSLEGEPELRERLFFHELFHVISRNNRDLRDGLYRLIGFVPCRDKTIPASLAERRVANPDAPVNRHYLVADLDGKEVGFIPYLHAAGTVFDAELGESFQSQFRFGLLVVDADGQCTARTEDGEAVLVAPQDAPGFIETIGRNTDYIIHPEEILASNFEYLMTGGMEELPNGDIPQRIGEFLGLQVKSAD